MYAVAPTESAHETVIEVGEVAVAVTEVGAAGGTGTTGLASFEKPDWPEGLVALTS